LGIALRRAKEPAGPAAQYPSLPYIAPFAVFMALLSLSRLAPEGTQWLYPARMIVVSAVVLIFSRNAIDLRPKNTLGSVLLGLAVFAIWIAPDLLWPGYRSHWLFTNSMTGEPRSSAPEALRSSLVFIAFRTLGCVLLVPVIEELFWRGWLPRWIIDAEDFQRAPLGAYSSLSFWAGSLLFASEHGPFWEVGLIAGIAYNWWMIRTKSLADCILTHAVTNGALSLYVLMTGRWQYWL
jgi:CAAX prenyl protease-like protein